MKPTLDTAPEIAAQLRARVLARTGGERVAMAARMFRTAKALILSRIRASGVSDEVDLRLAVLAQIYGTELSQADYDGVRTRLAARRTDP